jgi:hypothetical protein
VSDDVDTRGPRVAHPRCPFCHEDVRPDDEAKFGCPACMAWHHEPCWTENGGCATCGHDVARRPAPAEPAPAKEEAPATPRGVNWVVVGVVTGAAALVVGAGGLGRVLTRLQGETKARPAAAPDWRARLERASTEEERTAAVREGALAGDAGAMNMLGFRLMTGLGCARDPVAALEWGERAGEAGHAEAMFGVGLLLETGDGVPRDEARAAAWYRRAVAAGDTMAGPRLDALLRRRPDLR